LPAGCANREVNHAQKRKEAAMITKKIINPERIRHIEGGFSFIPHRFLTDGFLTFLTQQELLLYLFLVLVSDRYGLSYYAYDSICSLLSLSLDKYLEARNGLMKKDLIAFDGTLFQVLDLPPNPIKPHEKQEKRKDIAGLVKRSLKEVEYD
jgi:hypothetical protein